MSNEVLSIYGSIHQCQEQFSDISRRRQMLFCAHSLLRVRMVLRMGSLQTKQNSGLSEHQQEDLFQNECSFQNENSEQHVTRKLTRPPPTSLNTASVTLD